MENRGETVQIDVEMEEELVLRLDRVAKEQGRSVDDLVACCLEQYLEGKNFPNL